MTATYRAPKHLSGFGDSEAATRSVGQYLMGGHDLSSHDQAGTIARPNASGGDDGERLQLRVESDPEQVGHGVALAEIDDVDRLTRTDLDDRGTIAGLGGDHDLAQNRGHRRVKADGLQTGRAETTRWPLDVEMVIVGMVIVGMVIVGVVGHGFAPFAGASLVR